MQEKFSKMEDFMTIQAHFFAQFLFKMGKIPRPARENVGIFLEFPPWVAYISNE
jgi:hypothetical protein